MEKIPNYEGWTNKPTWAVKLWLDNNEGDCCYWHNRASELQAIGKFDRFAEDLKAEIESEQPELPNLYGDLLQWAIAYINYEELAEAFLQDIKED